MSRKYDKNIVEEMELIRKNPLAADIFEQISRLVHMYGGDTMMIASDLVSGKAYSVKMEPAYQCAVELIHIYGRCEFAGFLQVVEAWGRHNSGSDPSLALYFGEELLPWAATLPLHPMSDPGDIRRENVLDRGDTLETLDQDLWAGVTIPTNWDIAKAITARPPSLMNAIPAQHLSIKSIAYEPTYEGDFDKDFAEFKDHQYYKDFRLAVLQHNVNFEHWSAKMEVIQRNIGGAEFKRVCAIAKEAYHRGHFK